METPATPKEGQSPSVKIINVDRKTGNIGVSINGEEQDRTSARTCATPNQGGERRGPTTLGDLIKRQMDRKPGSSE